MNGRYVCIWNSLYRKQLIVLFLFYNADSVGWLMNNEIEKDLEGSGLDVIKVPSRPLSNVTEKNDEIHRIALETSTSWYKYRALRQYQQVLSINGYIQGITERCGRIWERVPNTKTRKNVGINMWPETFNLLSLSPH
jgi:hypothetical protein